MKRFLCDMPKDTSELASSVLLGKHSWMYEWVYEKDWESIPLMLYLSREKN